LYDFIQEKRRARVPGLSKDDLKEFLRQCSSGLFYIHKQELAHLDIKPANIFRSFCETVAVEQNFHEDLSNKTSVIYKIGDLGHVTQISAKSYDDGDCRYMPRELIDPKGKQCDLRKADVFALGLSAYEAATLAELPQNGPQWHTIRSDGVPKVKHVSEEINLLISSMIRENASRRPTAAEISESEVISPYMSNARLQQLLEEEVQKNKRLQRELRATQAAIGMFAIDHIDVGSAPKRMCIA